MVYLHRTLLHEEVGSYREPHCQRLCNDNKYGRARSLISIKSPHSFVIDAPRTSESVAAGGGGQGGAIAPGRRDKGGAC